MRTLLVAAIVAIAFAACSQSPATGIVPTSTQQPLLALAISLPYPILLPEKVPLALAQQPAEIITNGSHQLASVVYKDTHGTQALSILNGPAGCCLDSDTRKAISPIQLVNGDIAYFLRTGPDFGGDILWWRHAETYVALTSPRCTKEELTSIANSMREAQVVAKP